MYNQYYSSGDVQLYVTSFDFSKICKVDTAIEIGYSLQQSSAPIYSLGSRRPQFYSNGNTLGQGTLTIAFTDEEYLKYCLKEIDVNADVNYYQSTDSNGSVLNSMDSSGQKETHYKSKKYRYNNIDFNQKVTMARSLTVNERNISIGAITTTFNISLYINNETAITASDSKVINLIGVKITNESISTSSTRDAPLMITYQFLFKDIERG